MSVHGEVARRVCGDVLAQLDAAMPAGVRVVVTGDGRRCQLSVTSRSTARVLEPGDPDDARVRAVMKQAAPPADTSIHLGPGAQWSGVAAPMGFGPWIPMPSRLAAKLTLIDILEAIASLVSSAHGKPWPSAESGVSRQTRRRHRPRVV